MDKLEKFKNEDIERANQIISNLCQNNKNAFTMSIPPQINDSDMVLSRVVDQCERLLNNNTDKKPEDSNPLKKQEGGSHYKKFPIQPVEFIQKNNLNWCQGNVIKYVTRYKDKNGLEDLKKAKHYIDMLIDFEYQNPKES